MEWGRKGRTPSTSTVLQLLLSPGWYRKTEGDSFLHYCNQVPRGGRWGGIQSQTVSLYFSINPFKPVASSRLLTFSEPHPLLYSMGILQNCPEMGNNKCLRHSSYTVDGSWYYYQGPWEEEKDLQEKGVQLCSCLI